jgi:HTH-type transcriptional regulator, sugar sensing transcriptional regulator
VADAAALLQQLGFGDYEARAYVALLQRSPLNGYELAKASGLPRANVYAVLQKLEECGAVVRTDTPAGARYAAVPVAELVQRLGDQFRDTLGATERALDEVARPIEHEYVWNTREYPLLLEQARVLLEAAQQQALLAIWSPEAKALAPALAGAEARGVELTTLCLQGCPEECGGCRGRVYRYQVAPEQRARWLVLVADGAEVLAGEIGPNDAPAVRTRQRLLVELASWYIRHSIALAGVVSDLGGRLGTLVRPETRALLAAVGPGGRQGGWLEHMRRLLARAGPPPASEGKEGTRRISPVTHHETP